MLFCFTRMKSKLLELGSILQEYFCLHSGDRLRIKQHEAL